MDHLGYIILIIPAHFCKDFLLISSLVSQVYQNFSYDHDVHKNLLDSFRALILLFYLLL